MKRVQGYSLIEVMVSMAIFMIAAIPLLRMIGSVTTDFRGRDYLTAASLLDVTYEKIKLCPESLKRVERHEINGMLWLVQISRSGEKPMKFKVKVSRGGKEIETAQFYR